MVRSNVAIELPEKIMVTIDGRVTDNKTKVMAEKQPFYSPILSKSFLCKGWAVILLLHRY
jgi:hypothetical protein